MGYMSFDGYFGLGRQASQGSGVQPSFFVRYQTAKINEENLIKEFQEGGFGRQGHFVEKVGHNVGAELEAFLRGDLAGWLFTMALGSDTVSGTSAPYTHTITPSNLQWWSIEVAEINNTLVRRIIDAKANSLEISGKAEELISIKLEAMGLDLDASVSAATESYNDEGVFKFVHGSFTTMGGANEEINEFSVSINNNLELYRASGLTARQLLEKQLTCELSFTFKTTQDDEYRRVYYGGASGTQPSEVMEGGQVILTFNNGLTGADEREVKITFPYVKYSTLELTGLNADGEFLMYSASAIPVKTSGNHLITVEIKNAEANAYDGS